MAKSVNDKVLLGLGATSRRAITHSWLRGVSGWLRCFARRCFFLEKHNIANTTRVWMRVYFVSMQGQWPAVLWRHAILRTFQLIIYLCILLCRGLLHVLCWQKKVYVKNSAPEECMRDTQMPSRPDSHRVGNIRPPQSSMSHTLSVCAICFMLCACARVYIVVCFAYARPAHFFVCVSCVTLHSYIT